MRKIVLVLTSILFLCLQLTAQQVKTKQKPSFGILGGLNVTKLRLEGPNSGLIESDYRTGLAAGAFVNFQLGKRPFSLQPEFLYSSMGGDLLFPGNDQRNYRFNYFSVPVLLKYQFSRKLAAFAGPQVDIKIYGKETNKFGDINASANLEEFDALATWGLEWWPWKHVFVQGRYMHGFRKVYHVEPEISANNRGFQVSLGVRFHKAPPLPAPPAPPVAVAEKDSDGDGILDSKDKCPTVPGVARYEGCPVPDTDGDGIYDDKDKCPEMKGFPELDGCPYPDRDRDGVTDNKDRCPDEPGSTKNDGCPITDRDGDGVNDDVDRCPDTPGPASNQGCPEVKEDVITKTERIARSIYFQTNSARLQARSNTPLNELAQILKDNPQYNLSIEGHTDNVGSNEYNLTLSNNRANTVKNYLIGKGIDAARITAQGFGEEQPVADNNTSQGRSLNRRVVLTLSAQ